MIILDTHAWFFWVNDNIGQLSDKALEAIQSEETLGISVISCWEIAMLVQKGRLALTIDAADWIRHAEQLPAISFVPVNNQIAIKSTLLPEPLHKDPADRMIIATARHLACPLITADSKLMAYLHVDTIW